MTNEEVKKKIAEIALTELQVQFGCGDMVEVEDREACAESIADALIEAGFSFKDDFEVRVRLLLTAAQSFEEEKDREKQRADKAERALRKAVSLLSGANLCMLGPDGRILTEKDILKQDIYEAFLSQAEKELAEEGSSGKR